MSEHPDNPLLTLTIAPGDTWSGVIKQGNVLTLRDTSGLGNCTMLAFHNRNTTERYNMPDTLKGQHTSKLTAGNCLYSDMGRVLLSIAADDRGWHDPFGAYSNLKSLTKRYGEKKYQEHRNKWIRSTYDNLLVELGKHGLDGRDLHAPVNWFTKITVGDEGKMTFCTDGKKAGDAVSLKAELDVLVILSATPHPFDLASEWQPQPIDLQIATDNQERTLCRDHCPENGRAYTLTEQTLLAY